MINHGKYEEEKFFYPFSLRMQKRSITPKGNTPGKPSTKRSNAEGTHENVSSDQGEIGPHKRGPKTTIWSREETSQLVQYVALYWDQSSETSTWPKHKDESFWTSCAAYVADKTQKEQRAPSAMRSRVSKFLALNFSSIDKAEEFFNIDYESDFVTPKKSESIKQEFSSPSESISECLKIFQSSSINMKSQLLNKIFFSYLEELFDDRSLIEKFPKDCLSVFINAVENLHKKGKDNLIFNAAKCFTLREDKEQTRLPTGKMPFGLFDYMVKFFSRDTSYIMKCEKDYEDWQTSMYANFGVKWVCVSRGPCWEYEVEEDEGDSKELSEKAAVSPSAVRDPPFQITSSETASKDGLDLLATALQMSSLNENALIKDSPVYNTGSASTLWSPTSSTEIEKESLFGTDSQDSVAAKYGLGKESNGKENVAKVEKNPCSFQPMKAKVNVPGLSYHSLQAKIQESEFDRSSNVQVKIVKKIAQENPGGRYWIKADGCDVSKGLRESLQHVWSGDSDLGDGSLQKLYSSYMDRRNFALNLGLRNRKVDLVPDIANILLQLQDDKLFLEKGFHESKEIYNSRLDKKTSSTESLFALAWEVEGFKQLLNKENTFQTKFNVILSSLALSQEERGNIPLQLTHLREDLCLYLKNLFLKHRDAASHLLIFMIADERRNMKPYAIPVRVLSFHSLSDAKVRELKDELNKTLVEEGLNVVGFVTDWKWNSISTQGSERPVSVVQLMANACKTAKKTNINEIKKYFTLAPHTKKPIKEHAAIPIEDLHFLKELCTEGKTVDEAIFLFHRARFFPFNYDPHPWATGDKMADSTTCFKAVFAQYLYVNEINKY